MKQACGYDVILLKQLVITFTTSFYKLVVIGYMVISETRNIHIYQIEHMLIYNTQNILTSHVSYNYFPKKKRPYIKKSVADVPHSMTLLKITIRGCNSTELTSNDVVMLLC